MQYVDAGSKHVLCKGRGGKEGGDFNKNVTFQKNHLGIFISL